MQHDWAIWRAAPQFSLGTAPSYRARRHRFHQSAAAHAVPRRTHANAGTGAARAGARPPNRKSLHQFPFSLVSLWAGGPCAEGRLAWLVRPIHPSLASFSLSSPLLPGQQTMTVRLGSSHGKSLVRRVSWCTRRIVCRTASKHVFNGSLSAMTNASICGRGQRSHCHQTFVQFP